MKCIVQAKIPLEKYDKRWYLRVTHGKQANAKPKGNRIAPFKAAERTHDDGEDPDEWSLEVIHGEEYYYLVRTHNKSRVCLFMPSRMNDFPLKFEDSSRTTDQAHVLQRWRVQRARKSMDKPKAISEAYGQGMDRSDLLQAQTRR